MDRDECWRVIAEQRRSLADRLADLSDEEWETPSVCAGWRVRDVAAHIAMTPQAPGLAGMVGAVIRARGSFDRLNHDIAVRHAARPPAQLVEELREHADSRRRPLVTTDRNVLFDVLVHVQDIAIPLGRPLAMPTAAALAGAERVWTMGWPFWAMRRLRGLRLTATDVDWSVGDGEEVRAPIQALLLLLTGRVSAALPQLTGAGTARLTQRLTQR
jgi:uncharacterized protein (TIGR03083 family)